MRGCCRPLSVMYMLPLLAIAPLLMAQATALWMLTVLGRATACLLPMAAEAQARAGAASSMQRAFCLERGTPMHATTAAGMHI